MTEKRKAPSVVAATEDANGKSKTMFTSFPCDYNSTPGGEQAQPQKYRFLHAPNAVNIRGIKEGDTLYIKVLAAPNIHDVVWCDIDGERLIKIFCGGLDDCCTVIGGEHPSRNTANIIAYSNIIGVVVNDDI